MKHAVFLGGSDSEGEDKVLQAGRQRQGVLYAAAAGRRLGRSNAGQLDRVV